MIVVLDPALLLFDARGGGLAADEEAELATAIDEVVRVCRDFGGEIPSVDWYWRRLQSELVRPLMRAARGPRLRSGLDALGRYARALPMPTLPTTGTIGAWGLRPLFAWSGLPAGWYEVMTRLLVGCVLRDEPVVFATRLFAGRNMTIHAAGRTTLREKTRWRITLHVPGRPPRFVPCVRSPRNLAVEWTTRFDERLPDGGHYRFCPPARWWRRNVVAYRTVKSKPCWIDGFGSGWAQPGAGGNLHWDVFLEAPGLVEAVGLSAINVVAWGSGEAGKVPGEIHHVPEDKRSAFRGGGWTRPD
jgi:hypothetical protein